MMLCSDNEEQILFTVCSLQGWVSTVWWNLGVPVEHLLFTCCAPEAGSCCSFGVSLSPPLLAFFFFLRKKILFIVNPRGFPKLALWWRACFLSLNIVRRACPAEHIHLLLRIFSLTSAKLQFIPRKDGCGPLYRYIFLRHEDIAHISESWAISSPCASFVWWITESLLARSNSILFSMYLVWDDANKNELGVELSKIQYVKLVRWCLGQWQWLRGEQWD